jgi:hypothetical protein
VARRERALVKEKRERALVKAIIPKNTKNFSPLPGYGTWGVRMKI